MNSLRAVIAVRLNVFKRSQMALELTGLQGTTEMAETTEETETVETTTGVDHLAGYTSSC